MCKPKSFLIILVLVWVVLVPCSGQVLEVGQGYPYPSLEDAAMVAVPGDTILVHEGFYPGGAFVDHLQGTSTAWIRILAAPGESVVYLGGTNAWQFTDAAYLEIRGFVFQQQTGNGVNFDDGGSYETPSHHILFDQCYFRDINATGNNDLLKLSGIDSFEIRNCLFFNGAAGGSGIDMVGCHDGQIHNNHFEDLGSNAIQAKGGTRNIRIERNFFRNAGARAVNLGGSTGLQFFRPLDAPYEAADLKVYSNVFIGSDAPIAYVGTINTEVVNNTIYLPTKWVLRILQETVDTTRFPPCGYNTFRNNIVYIDDRVNVECNIGPNTEPETFTFSNNLWYHSENGNWPGPDLPVTDANHIVGEDPLFENSGSADFSLRDGSPATGRGWSVADPVDDYIGKPFLSPRSIGAYEGGETSGIEDAHALREKIFTVFPNPAKGILNIWYKTPIENAKLSLHGVNGAIELRMPLAIQNPGEPVRIPIPPALYGLYVLTVEHNGLKDSQVVFIDR